MASCTATGDMKETVAGRRRLPPFHGFERLVRRAKATSVRLYNLMKRPLRLGKVTCSLEGAKVSVPDGNWVEPGRYATIRLEVPEAGLPPGPIQGTVTVETNCPEHALTAVPVDGTALVPRRTQ